MILRETIGSDIQNTLRESGAAGDFIEVSEPVCCGPVPRGGDYGAIRARFIAGWFPTSAAETAAPAARCPDTIQSQHPAAPCRKGCRPRRSTDSGLRVAIVAARAAQASITESPMKISILAVTLGVAALAAAPAFAQSRTQAPASDGTPAMTHGPGIKSGTGTSGTTSTFKSGSKRGGASQASGVGSQTIKQVQQKLAEKGMDVGPADGRIGPKTRSAVKKFQQDNGIQATGQLNRQTLAALGVGKARGGRGGAGSSSQMNKAPSVSPSAGPGSGSAGSGGSSSTGGSSAMPR